MHIQSRTYVQLYVIYKPQILSVFDRYMTRVQGQRNFAAHKQQAQHVIVALIHMIYTTYSTTIQ